KQPRATPITAGVSHRWRVVTSWSQAAGKPVRCDNTMPTKPSTPNTAMAGQENSTDRGSSCRPAPTKVMNRFVRPMKASRTSHARVEFATVDSLRIHVRRRGLAVCASGCRMDCAMGGVRPYSSGAQKLGCGLCQRSRGRAGGHAKPRPRRTDHDQADDHVRGNSKEPHVVALIQARQQTDTGD